MQTFGANQTRDLARAKDAHNIVRLVRNLQMVRVHVDNAVQQIDLLHRVAHALVMRLIAKVILDWRAANLVSQRHLFAHNLLFFDLPTYIDAPEYSSRFALDQSLEIYVASEVFLWRKAFVDLEVVVRANHVHPVIVSIF